MNAIALIDCGVGNLRAFSNALTKLRLWHSVCTAPSDLPSRTSYMILPGVGNCGFMMERLVSTGWNIALRRHVENDGPLLGVCAGAQVLFDTSEEAPDNELLSLVPGVVTRNPNRTLNIGWRHVSGTLGAKPEIALDDFFFFNHAFSVSTFPTGAQGWRSSTADGYEFVAGFSYENIIGIQFHPEKSHSQGLKLLQKILEG
jgi:glutamine amidotransferase